ncbi:sulfotransferase [Arenimonas composti]|uniref:Sulfotransferase domain-containing protein n=1 Tax=Arenimonas composti TR7-09 = DSM 18010 TaxID=1121013 RepID=A0A091BX21_9GAMM|nr:sulfotransferase [Arenimonas composti]KFN48880.1 hypothetical protein P873_13080 [Arenimonas composti TR7-09 = DSM 18010]
MTLRIAYVAGYGRSGSTLLDIMLGAAAGATSLGETGMLWLRHGEDAEACSCGARLRDCPVWAPVVAGVESGEAIARDRAAHRREGWFRGFFAPRRAAVEDRYGRAWAQVFATLAQAHGTPLLIDSSKTAYRYFWRPSALARDAGADVRVLHLVRDPRAVVLSCMKGQNSRLAVGDESVRPAAWAIALVGWLVANLGAALNARRLGRPRLLVQYERLVAAPGEELARIGRFLDADFAEVAERLQRAEPLPVGHLVAGNRMARRGVVLPAPQPPVERLPSRLAEFACRWFAVPIHARLLAGAAQDAEGQ